RRALANQAIETELQAPRLTRVPAASEQRIDEWRDRRARQQGEHGETYQGDDDRQHPPLFAFPKKCPEFCNDARPCGVARTLERGLLSSALIHMGSFHASRTADSIEPYPRPDDAVSSMSWHRVPGSAPARHVQALERRWPWASPPQKKRQPWRGETPRSRSAVRLRSTPRTAGGDTGALPR